MNRGALDDEPWSTSRGVARGGGAAGYICPRAPRYRGAKMMLTKSLVYTTAALIKENVIHTVKIIKERKKLVSCK